MQQIAISIHALREEGDLNLTLGDVTAILISIHALREEGDKIWQFVAKSFRISIHALREEGDSCITAGALDDG